MASLIDIFNPSFFLFLGIMILVVSMLVVYFESKLREQNHKIASMFSLVSSLANDVIRDKQQTQNGLPQNASNKFPFMFNKINEHGSMPDLIPVSDDESEESEESETNSEESDTNSEESDTDIDDETIVSLSNKNINISNELGRLNQIDEIDETINIEEDLNKTLHQKIDQQYFILEDNINKQDSKEPEPEPEPEPELLKISSTDLKTININLDEPLIEDNTDKSTVTDYKKLPLQKLRSIVVEKQLVTDASKFKKNELLKMLNIEL